MKIYTRTGDDGSTGLFGGDRVSKADDRVEAYGTLDELNSAIGVVRASGVDTEIDTILGRVQRELFELGAELGTDPGHIHKLKSPLLSADQVQKLEQDIDAAEVVLPPLRTFVVPGGALPAAQLHACRTLCRRAERNLVALANRDALRPEVIRYANRLADLLFVLARLANHKAQVPDVPWP